MTTFSNGEYGNFEFNQNLAICKKFAGNILVSSLHLWKMGIHFSCSTLNGIINVKIMRWGEDLGN